MTCKQFTAAYANYGKSLFRYFNSHVLVSNANPYAEYKLRIQYATFLALNTILHTDPLNMNTVLNTAPRLV